MGHVFTRTTQLYSGNEWEDPYLEVLISSCQSQVHISNGFSGLTTLNYHSNERHDVVCIFVTLYFVLSSMNDNNIVWAEILWSSIVLGSAYAHPRT